MVGFIFGILAFITQTWNGQLPETYVGDDSVSSVLIGK